MSNVKVGICGCNRNYVPPVIYKTIILKPNYCCNKNILTQDMLNEENVKYVIKYNFNLDGERITVPENCILEFDGGSLKNGTIIGQDTVFINVGDVDIWGENLTREGTWREHSGGGGEPSEYIKDASVSTDGNTLILTKKDETIVTFTPDGGGSSDKFYYPERFGAKGDGVTNDTQAFQDCIDAVYEAGGGDIILGAKTYIIDSIDLKVKTNLIGQGQGNTILKSLTDGVEGRGIINILSYATLCIISNLSVVGTNVTENNVTRHTNKDGIHIQYGDPGNAVPDTSFRWQENRVDPETVDETKTQTYRNITIQNVYVGECNYGIKCENQAYRVNILCCDIKRCNYGIDFPITDSSIHECYIERCKYDGLIVTGSNNSITNVKSIWNGAGDVVNSYGINIRGSRNRVSNCEAQDNYCSGIRVTGQQHIISNVMANTDGYIKSTGELTSEELAIDTCEWYINTMTTVFSNCVATSYSDRNNHHFPKYPILIGAAHEDFGSRVQVVGRTGTILAREPITPDVPISCTHSIPFDADNIYKGVGYKIGDDKLVSKGGPDSFVANSINMAAIFEIVPTTIESKQTLFRYGDYLSLTLSVRPVDGTTVMSANNLYIESGFGNVYPNKTHIDYVDYSKPIRFFIRSTSRGQDINGNYNLECFLGLWYYDSAINAYRYNFDRQNINVDRKTAAITENEVRFNPNNVIGNEWYLRKFLVTNDVCLPDCVAYPGYPLNDIRPIMSFDYETLSEYQQTDEGIKGYSDGINRIPNSAEMILLTTQAREAGKWAQVYTNADMPAIIVSVNHSLIPEVINGIQITNAEDSGRDIGARLSLDTVNEGKYIYSMQIKGTGRIYCAYGYYDGEKFIGKNLPEFEIDNDDFEQFRVSFELSKEYVDAMKTANATFDFYVYLKEGDNEVIFCAPKLEKGNICTGWTDFPNISYKNYKIFMAAKEQEV